MDKSINTFCDLNELAGLYEKADGLNDFLQTVVSTIAYHMEAAVCSIYLHDAASGELLLAANQGLNRSVVGQLRLKMGEGLTGKALVTKSSVCEGLGSNHPDFKHFPGIDEEQYQAFLAVPVLRAERKIGVIVVQDPEPDYFDSKSIDILESISHQLAGPIEDAMLFISIHEVVEHRQRQLELDYNEPLFVKGISGTDGIAKGKTVRLDQNSYDVLTAIDDDDDCTIETFETAIKKTEAQLSQLQRETEKELSDVASLIFSAHLLMLMDDAFTGEMRDKINNGISPSRAVVKVVNQYIELFSNSENQRLAEKVQDLKDLGHRMLYNLSHQEEDVADYHGQILIAEELLPSDILKLATQNVEGLIIMQGGGTAHISILATSLEIPLVFSDDPQLSYLLDDTPIIMDASQGTIFIRPNNKVIEQYDKMIADQASLEDLAKQVRPETFTRDGAKVQLVANINLLSDLKTAKSFKAEGVGLYRSEFPFIVRADFPTGEEQYKIYRKIATEMGDRPVIFRTLDIGGDKLLPYGDEEEESNPFLGLRGIRFLLHNKKVFSEQLRAMLRACHDTECRIMFPMVSSVDDFVEAQEMVRLCSNELNREGIPHNAQPQLGVMIEVPSAVEVINELAEEVDFLSIGTNDLIQYMLAVDRTNEKVSEYYRPYHPAVLRAIRKVAIAAKEHEIEVSVCGNMASDPRMIPFLIGIGITKLSMDPRAIPATQNLIEQLFIGDSELTAAKMLSLGEIKELKLYLENMIAEHQALLEEA